MSTFEHPRCIIPHCGGFHIARGLCANCYAKASKLVKQGRTSWPYLEKHGLASVTARRMRGDSHFAQAFNAQSPDKA